MKHIIYGISLLAVAIMVIAGVMVASGGEVRGNEADKALNTAVEQSLEQLMKYGSYQIGNEQELVADFQQALLLHISPALSPCLSASLRGEDSCSRRQKGRA